MEEAALLRCPYVPAVGPIILGLAVLHILLHRGLCPSGSWVKMCSHLIFLYLVSDGVP